MAMLQYRHKSRAWRQMVTTDAEGNPRAIKDLIALGIALGVFGYAMMYSGVYGVTGIRVGVWESLLPGFTPPSGTERLPANVQGFGGQFIPTPKPNPQAGGGGGGGAS